jgi:acyl-coenzyme A thioesterase PaaI-like protein
MELPELHLEKLKENSMCFGCGKANPFGLKMKFSQDGEIAKSEFVPTAYHQGWPGYVHGGVLMAAIDEGLGWTIFSKELYAVTAKIDIRLKSMARIGEPLIVNAWITKRTSRTIEVEARIQRKDDSVVAEAAGLLFIVK